MGKTALPVGPRLTYEMEIGRRRIICFNHGFLFVLSFKNGRSDFPFSLRNSLRFPSRSLYCLRIQVLLCFRSWVCSCYLHYFGLPVNIYMLSCLLVLLSWFVIVLCSLQSVSNFICLFVSLDCGNFHLQGCFWWVLKNFQVSSGNSFFIIGKFQ